MFVRAVNKDGKLDQDRFSKSVSKHRSAFNNREANVKNQSYKLMKQLIMSLNTLKENLYLKEKLISQQKKEKN